MSFCLNLPANRKRGHNRSQSNTEFDLKNVICKNTNLKENNTNKLKVQQEKFNLDEETKKNQQNSDNNHPLNSNKKKLEVTLNETDGNNEIFNNIYNIINTIKLKNSEKNENLEKNVIVESLEPEIHELRSGFNSIFQFGLKTKTNALSILDEKNERLNSNFFVIEEQYDVSESLELEKLKKNKANNVKNNNYFNEENKENMKNKENLKNNCDFFYLKKKFLKKLNPNQIAFDKKNKNKSFCNAENISKVYNNEKNNKNSSFHENNENFKENLENIRKKINNIEIYKEKIENQNKLGYLETNFEKIDNKYKSINKLQKELESTSNLNLLEQKQRKKVI